VGVRRYGFDAIRAPHFAGQVLSGLVASNIAFGIFDRWFRCQFVNEALAKINRIPVRDHIGETLRTIAGEVALKAEPILQAVFDTGKVISGFEITGKLQKRPEVGHWIATYFPIRDARGRIIQVGVLSAEIAASGVNQLAERVTLNANRIQELTLDLQLLRGERGLFRGDPEHIIDGVTEATGKCGCRPENGSVILSHREQEIVRSLANGMSNKEIAAALEISVKTVECYRSRVFLKLKLGSLASLVRYAIRNRMVEL
jgi:DNA-binding NarL/FixJ family response regulator